MVAKLNSYHHGDLRAAIIAATLHLVREKGPRGFTLHEAAREAGVSKSAPYKHFRDKDALLAEIAVLGTRTLEAELRAAAEQAKTARRKLLAVFGAYIGFARQRPDFFAVMFQSGMDKSSYPEIEEAATSAFGVAVSLATEIETTQESVAALSLAVWTMAHGFAMLISEDAFARTSWKVTAKTANQIAETFLLGGSFRKGDSNL